MKKLSALFAFVGLIVFISVSGCASLINYTERSSSARAFIASGDFSNALSDYGEKEAQGKNEVLIRMERGMILQSLGEFDQSSKEFDKASGKIKEHEDRALISAKKTAYQAGTLLINEQVMPYQGEDFEIILLHALDAVNYLMRGDLEGARVEVRKTYERQEHLNQKHERALTDAQDEEKFPEWEDSFDQADSQGYTRLKEKASTIVSLYQNGFASYVSALVYELNGEFDEAYIDLKKAYQAYPGCKSIQGDLIRLSKKNGFREDEKQWESQFGTPKAAPEDAIDVFVIFTYGLAPYKEPISFPIPISNGFTFASLPVYQFTPSSVSHALVMTGDTREETSAVFDVDAVAARNLLDEFPVIFVKQIARSVLKANMTRQLSKKNGDVAALLGTIYSAVTEQADLRSWLSLPKQIQVARLFVPRSSPEVSITSMPAGQSSSFAIPPGASHVVVYCRATENGMVTHIKSF